MKETLQSGLRYSHKFVVPASKTVPSLYPEADEFLQMPEVFATGFLEWACILCLKPHLDWPNEQSVGTHIDVSHVAATPPGFEVRADVELIEVEGRRLVFNVEAHDHIDLIAKGRHERFIIDKSRFDQRLQDKIKNHNNPSKEEKI